MRLCADVGKCVAVINGALLSRPTGLCLVLSDLIRSRNSAWTSTRCSSLEDAHRHVLMSRYLHTVVVTDMCNTSNMESITSCFLKGRGTAYANKCLWNTMVAQGRCVSVLINTSRPGSFTHSGLCGDLRMFYVLQVVTVSALITGSFLKGKHKHGHHLVSKAINHHIGYYFTAVSWLLYRCLVTE